jgi:hypothetical protein
LPHGLSGSKYNYYSFLSDHDGVHTFNWKQYWVSHLLYIVDLWNSGRF